MDDFRRVESSATGWGRAARSQIWGGPLPPAMSEEDYATGLPADVQWYSARMSWQDLSTLYHRCGVYRGLSGNTLHVARSALIVEQGIELDDQATAQASRIREIVDRFAQEKLTPLHLCTNDIEGGPYNVMDGNCRAVALAILDAHGEASRNDIAVFLATSPTAQLRDHVGRDPATR